MMKFLILNVILCCAFASCTNRQPNMKSQNESGHISAQIDTIYLEEGFSKDFIKNYTCKTEMKDGFPKNDTVFMEITGKNKFKDIIKHCTIEIQPLSDSVLIRRVDNTHFTIFIKPEYTPRIVDMNVYLHPKKNIALITYSGEEVTMYPDYIQPTMLRDLVAGN